jgi:hypothetical protein
VVGLDLVYEGRRLADDLLISELYDNDEDDDHDVDDDEGDDQESFKVLTLNVVPPVDPKFGVELTPKLKAHAEDDEDTLTTEEIVDAYFLNQAAMTQNARLLNDDPSTTTLSPLLRLEIQEQARQLKERFRSEVPDDVWQSSLEAIKRDHNIEDIRGQRYRSGKGGARTSLKKSIQTNLNIVSVEGKEGMHDLMFEGFSGSHCVFYLFLRNRIGERRYGTAFSYCSLATLVAEIVFHEPSCSGARPCAFCYKPDLSKCGPRSFFT